MLKEIRLKNFKCFREETIFPLSTINLLTGINGRGKSTLLQSMLLMKQSVEHNEYTNKLILNGNCVNLGGYIDVTNYDNDFLTPIYFDFLIDKLGKTNNFKIPILAYEEENSRMLKLVVGDEETLSSAIELLSEENPLMGNEEEMERISEKMNIEENQSYYEKEFLRTYIRKLLSPFSKIHYVAADRLGSQEFYKKINLNDFISVDKKGKNLATVLFELKESLVNDKLYLGQDAKNLEEQVGEWLSQIFDTTVEIGVEDTVHTFEVSFTINGKQHKPNNVGFGYSYILPIIVSGLIAKEGEILIIENPEAHLHPKAQSELTKFVAKVASCGVQIFIESHSEHILNGLRVAMLQEDIEINNEDLNILYFQDGEENPFVTLDLQPNGKIKNWVDGFFDQQEQDLAEIFKLGRKQK